MLQPRNHSVPGLLRKEGNNLQMSHIRAQQTLICDRDNSKPVPPFVQVLNCENLASRIVGK
jgi:hypothetical protein